MYSCSSIHFIRWILCLAVSFNNCAYRGVVRRGSRATGKLVAAAVQHFH